jgi:ribonuclease HI
MEKAAAARAATQTKEESSRMDKVEIFTDGACKGNPGSAAGAHCWWRARPKEIFGGARDTTNNRMELQAVIEALSAEAAVHGGAAYGQPVCAKGISEWIHGWKARGWKTSTKEPVKNEDLWKALDAAQHAHRGMALGARPQRPSRQRARRHAGQPRRGSARAAACYTCAAINYGSLCVKSYSILKPPVSTPSWATASGNRLRGAEQPHADGE